MAIGTKVVCIGGIIAFAILAGKLTPERKPIVGCPDPRSTYSRDMEDQIQELCIFGLSRTEAVNGLNVVYRTPGINPQAAADIVKTGANIAARQNNPDPWKTR